jgi:putative protease
MPVFEDEHGTYIMNARDLRAVEHVAQLAEIGIDCLKIEGRTKSHYYAARTTRAYRQAIDDALAGRPFRRELLADLDGLANRGYTEGFYRRHAPAELQNYADGASRNDRGIFVGEITAFDPATGLADIEVKNRFDVGDELDLITPGATSRFRLAHLTDSAGAPIPAAPGSGWSVRARVPAADASYGLLVRAIHDGE